MGAVGKLNVEIDVEKMRNDGRGSDADALARNDKCQVAEGGKTATCVADYDLDAGKDDKKVSDDELASGAKKLLSGIAGYVTKVISVTENAKGDADRLNGILRSSKGGGTTVNRAKAFGDLGLRPATTLAESFRALSAAVPNLRKFGELITGFGKKDKETCEGCNQEAAAKALTSGNSTAQITLPDIAKDPKEFEAFIKRTAERLSHNPQLKEDFLSLARDVIRINDSKTFPDSADDDPTKINGKEVGNLMTMWDVQATAEAQQKGKDTGKYVKPKMPPAGAKRKLAVDSIRTFAQICHFYAAVEQESVGKLATNNFPKVEASVEAKLGYTSGFKQDGKVAVSLSTDGSTAWIGKPEADGSVNWPKADPKSGVVSHDNTHRPLTGKEIEDLIPLVDSGGVVFPGLAKEDVLAALSVARDKTKSREKAKIE